MAKNKGETFSSYSIFLPNWIDWTIEEIINNEVTNLEKQSAKCTSSSQWLTLTTLIMSKSKQMGVWRLKFYLIIAIC